MSCCADDAYWRGIPVQRLSNIQTAVRVWKRIDALEEMSIEALKYEYGVFDLPTASATLENRSELLARLKAAALWRELPLRELQKECEKHGIVASGMAAVSASEAETAGHDRSQSFGQISHVSGPKVSF